MSDKIIKMNPKQTEITPQLKAKREALDKVRKWGEENKGWKKKQQRRETN